MLGPPENLTLVHLTHLSLNTSTATVTWWPPHNIPIVDHVQEYRLEWNKIPVLNGVFTEPHFDSTWLPAVSRISRATSILRSYLQIGYMIEGNIVLFKIATESGKATRSYKGEEQIKIFSLHVNYEWKIRFNAAFKMYPFRPNSDF